MTIKIRGVTFEENLNNAMGLEFYNLSHRFGYQSPNWPYFEDVKIERIHYMAKSGVLSQRITTSMHNTTHIDAPGHVIAGAPFIDEVPLPHFFGSGIVLSIPKKMWEPITYDDLEKAGGKHVRPGDVVLINTAAFRSERCPWQIRFCHTPFGQMAIQGINSRDYNVVQGVVLVNTAIFVVLLFLVDISYGMLDPRVRRQGRGVATAS